MTTETWPWVAREVEHRTVAQIASGDLGGALITGGAGVGKTRLAREALARAGERGRRTAWASATEAARAVPLGALAHLVPPTTATSSTLTLQHAASALRDGNGTGPMILGVDDAHLLDPLSVALVHQLATAGAVTVVLTVRDDLAPTSLSELWKDGVLERVELGDLGRAETDELVRAALRGEVDSRTAERLWQLSRGNPLFLRELVAGGRESGALRKQDGMWRWDVPPHPSGRITEIVLAQLAVTDDEQAVLEVLAVGEPVHLTRLVRIAGSGTVAALERRGLVAVDRRTAPLTARVAHPLHASVLRARVPASEVSRICRQLIAEPADQPAMFSRSEPSHADPSHTGLSHTARLLLDGDTPHLHPALLTDAAEHACAEGDHASAERMARAAVDRGGGFAAHLALVEAVRWQGRAAEAEQLALVATTTADTTQRQARLAATRATNLLCGLGRADEAEVVLRAARDGFADGDPTDAAAEDLDGARALLTLLCDGPDRLPQPELTAHPLIAAAAAAGMAVAGRSEGALVAVASGRAALERLPAPAVAFPEAVLEIVETLALWSAGRTGELASRAAELHRRTLGGPASAADALAALHRGWADLAVGRGRSAVRWLSEAVGGLRLCDPCGLLEPTMVALALAHTLVGEGGAARELLDELSDEPESPPVRLLLGLVHGWQAAVDDEDPTAAAELTIGAAATAGSAPVLEATMLHTAVRFGRPGDVRERLRALADSLDSPLVEVFAAHAEAAAEGTADGLEDAGDRFAEMDARLLAAEALVEAATAQARAGSRRVSATLAARARTLAEACEGARTPALARLDTPRLTTREEEVARMALDELDNQSIAHRLVLSVRTVEAHLAKTYTKLGINSRGELRAALGPSSLTMPEQRGRGGRVSGPTGSVAR